MNEHHEMRLVRTTASGSEEWHCPSCERRILLQWAPRYELVVLVRGEEHVAHAGGKGEPPVAGAEPAPAPARPENPGETYGVGPVQEIPRGPGPAEVKPEPAAEDRRWLRENGIAWDSDSAA